MDQPAPVSPVDAQAHFMPAAIISTADLGVSQTLAPDNKTLSVLFSALESRISEKESGPGGARLVRVLVPVANQDGAKVTASLRGSFTRSEKAAAQCFVIAGDQFRTSGHVDGNFEFQTEFTLASKQNEWDYSIYIGCTRSVGKDGDAHVVVDSVDFTVAPGAVAQEPAGG